MTWAVAVALLASALFTGCTRLKRFAYEGIGRDAWQQPERVVAALGIRPGDRIADVGAGGGYFTFRLADATGPTGVVWAVDVDPGMIAYLRDRAAADGRANVRVIEAASDDPRLPDGEVDLLFTSNTYHHLPAPRDWFARARRALAPNGRVAIVEHRRGGVFARLFGHATGADTIRNDMEAAGYRLVAAHDFLDRQSFQVFAPAP